MLEIALVSDGVLYYFEKVSWLSIEQQTKIKMIAEDNTILIMEDKDGEAKGNK